MAFNFMASNEFFLFSLSYAKFSVKQKINYFTKTMVYPASIPLPFKHILSDIRVGKLIPTIHT